MGAFGGRRSEEQDELLLLISTRHLNLWQNFRELQFVYIIIEIMYWKRHMAEFKAIPRFCSIKPKEVRDQRHCPGLEMSTAGLSVRLSVHLPVQPGLLWLVPGPRSRRLVGWVSARCVSQGALLYYHFSKYSLTWLLASACRQGFKPETLSVLFVLPASAHLGGATATVLNLCCIS